MSRSAARLQISISTNCHARPDGTWRAALRRRLPPPTYRRASRGGRDESGALQGRFPLCKIPTCQRPALAQNFPRRGYSLMVKLQPSKLAMRVRFPLPALRPTAGVSTDGSWRAALRRRRDRPRICVASDKKRGPGSRALIPSRFHLAGRPPRTRPSARPYARAKTIRVRLDSSLRGANEAALSVTSGRSLRGTNPAMIMARDEFDSMPDPKVVRHLPLANFCLDLASRQTARSTRSQPFSCASAPRSAVPVCL